MKNRISKYFIIPLLFISYFSVITSANFNVVANTQSNKFVLTDYIKKTMALDLGVAYTYGGFFSNKQQYAGFVTYKDNFGKVNVYAKLGASLVAYNVETVNDNLYNTTLPSTKTYSLNEKFYGIDEAKLSYSFNNKYSVGLGRQRLTWGQVDYISVITLFTLPVSDTVIAIVPNKTDILHPQDILYGSYFINPYNEITAYYFFNPNLSPTFNDIVGKNIFTKAPPVLALRYQYYGSKLIFATTLFSGVSFWGGVNDKFNIQTQGNVNQNTAYTLNNINTITLPSYFSASSSNNNDIAQSNSITQATRYARSYAIALEGSYDINSKWKISNDFVVDYTEKNISLANILGNYITDYLATEGEFVNNLTNELDKCKSTSNTSNSCTLALNSNNTTLTDSLNFFAKNGLLYNTSTFINNLAISYTGTRVDAVLGATLLFTKYNLFSAKNANAYRKLEENVFTKNIMLLPLINVSYSFNDEKNKKVGAFAGNQGGLFGAGVYSAYEINQYVSLGGSAGAYFGFQDLLGLIKSTNIIDPNYSVKEDSDTILQANFAFKFSL